MTADVWIIGAAGQLGFALSEHFGPRAVGFTRADVDLADPARLATALAGRPPPRLIFNASAYTLVDRAESERALCLTLNAAVPGALAAFAREIGADFVHYSTDFVFSGEGDRAWRESDEPAPLNFYGESKWLGERAVLQENPTARVFRTAWVYSHRRQNFPLAILKRARESGRLDVVSDQVGSPTFVDDLARFSAEACASPFTTETAGVFHLANSGFVSRFDFARAIVESAARFEPDLAQTQIRALTTEATSAPARRPLNTRLDLEKFGRTFDLTPPEWRGALARAVEKMYANH